VWSVAFSADAERLVTTSDDQTVRVWSVSDGQLLRVMRGHTGPAMVCAPLPDGERVLSGSYDKTVRVWDLHSGAQVGLLAGADDWILSLVTTPDGEVVIAGTRSGSLHVWDLEAAQTLARLPVHRGPVMSLDFDPAVGLLSGSADETAAILSVRPFDVAT
jgi:WD40 repeat protein